MSNFDVQDLISLAGVAAIIFGLWMWSEPAAIVAFGCVCLLVARRVENEKALRGKSERKS